jgi:TnpA family transposase
LSRLATLDQDHAQSVTWETLKADLNSVARTTAEHDLRLHYTLSENDLAIIRSKRGLHNRLGFAIQLCYLRFPGQAMTLEAEQLAELLAHVARQIQASTAAR